MSRDGLLPSGVRVSFDPMMETTSPTKITGANAGGPCPFLPLRTPWAARVAPFWP